MICVCVRQHCSLPYTFLLVDACRTPLILVYMMARCVKI